jgi:hypothetical protein
MDGNRSYKEVKIMPCMDNPQIEEKYIPYCEECGSENIEIETRAIVVRQNMKDYAKRAYLGSKTSGYGLLVTAGSVTGTQYILICKDCCHTTRFPDKEIVDEEEHNRNCL